jgi:predicted nicotinamide N-methyase
MTASSKEAFLKKVVDFNIFYKKRRFNKTVYIKRHLDYIFENVDLKGKKILDVGGGAGLMALYGAFSGAKKAICIEPESDGSTIGFRQIFNTFKQESGIITEAENLNETFQSFYPKAQDKFDLVVFHNSINHLDEPACQNLLTDDKARDSYNKIFKELNNIMSENSTVIILDCGRRNFFNTIGLESPFARNIEWDKHQEPEEWIRLMKNNGFSNFEVTWSSHEALGKLGEIFTGNRFCSYFLFSHFKIVAKKEAQLRQ